MVTAGATSYPYQQSIQWRLAFDFGHLILPLLAIRSSQYQYTTITNKTRRNMELSPVAASSQRPPVPSPKTSSLLQLPTEVVVKILTLLDIKELIAFHRVRHFPPLTKMTTI